MSKQGKDLGLQPPDSQEKEAAVTMTTTSAIKNIWKKHSEDKEKAIITLPKKNDAVLQRYSHKGWQFDKWYANKKIVCNFKKTY